MTKGGTDSKKQGRVVGVDSAGQGWDEWGLTYQRETEESFCGMKKVCDWALQTRDERRKHWRSWLCRWSSCWERGE